MAGVPVPNDVYPWSSVVVVTSRWFDGSVTTTSLSSGVVIDVAAGNYVLTASHAVFDPVRGEADLVEVAFPTGTGWLDPAAPGDEGKLARRVIRADRLHYHRDYDPDADGLILSGDRRPGTRGGAELDIALLRVPQPIGQVSGTMRLDDGFATGVADVTGHPDKPGRPETTERGLVARVPDDDLLDLSGIEISPGLSGGPVWRGDGGAPVVTGIVSTAASAVAVAPWLPWIEQAVRDDGAAASPGGAVGLSGGGRDDALSGGAANDALEGNGGNDVLSGGPGDDALGGGDGTDTATFADARERHAVSRDGDAILVIGPEGRDRLVGVERLQFAGGAPVALDDALAAEPPHLVAVHDAATGREAVVSLAPVGPGAPSYLRWQHLHDGGSVAIDCATPDVFIRTGGGNDAIQATSGTNVLDGGAGSNFLVGGTGADGGTDTFFTDARLTNANGAVWNTLVNFGAGDAATLWGFLPGAGSWHWDGVGGADGYAGATLRADTRGTGVEDASITFAGLSVVQAQALQTSTGSVGGQTYLYFRPGVAGES